MKLTHINDNQHLALAEHLKLAQSHLDGDTAALSHTWL
jgi:hypothetical protein